MLSPRQWIEQRFPRLTAAGYELASPVDENYNCVAFAAGELGRFWWPTPLPPFEGGYHWPDGVPRELTISAFAAAFETLGYTTCSDGAFEVGFEKVAVYAKDGVPKHAARQMVGPPRWVSKLGTSYDIAHDDVEGVGGEDYGEVAVFMRRPLLDT